MKLVQFDAGSGPRAGLVRKTFVVDLHQANGFIPVDFDAVVKDSVALERARALEVSCPDRSVLRRRSEVKVLREVDA
ncbi:MAG: hypothetical protein V4510_11590 [bacterium]